MIVCMCSRMTDAQVREAAAKGAKTVADVFRVLNKRRSCGQCSDDIESVLDQVKAESAGQKASAT